MREILFRGKRIDNNKWTEGYYFKIWNKVYLLWGTNNDVPIMIEVIPETVGQFTELTDKNSKKIFEGDILQGTIISAWDNWIIKCQVEFRNASFISVEIDSNKNTYKLKWGKDIEVIGNIHDNPELLEAK